MKTIDLVSVELSGFRSFTKQTVIDFSADAGLKLITGDNQVEPTLGANGAGKSTLFDAVCWCAYGISVRGKKTAELVSWGSKETYVECIYRIDGAERRVRRAGPPEKAFIDGEPVDQAEIDHLLGLSKARFLHSVLFGQAVPFFIDLPIPARGEVIDEIMDSGFWLEASDKARKNATDQERAIATLDREIAGLDGEMRVAEENATVTDAETQWEDKRKQRMEEIFDLADAAEADIETLEEQVTDSVKGIDPDKIDDLHARVEELKRKATDAERELAKLELQSDKLNEDYEFFANHDLCPTCDQSISDTFAEDHLAEISKKRSGIEHGLSELEAALSDTKINLQAEQDEWRTEFDLQTRLGTALSTANVRLASKKRELDSLAKQVETIDAETNPYVEARAQAEQRKAQINIKLEQKRSDKSAASGKQAQFEYWKTAFKRVRLFAIKRIMQQLEIETMNSAAALGLIGWKITYATETENKSGTMKPGVQIEVTTPHRGGKFDTYSPGEGQRVRVAVALGFASMIQRYAGVRYGFEAFDEPSAWLSEKGIEDLLECLHRRAELTQKSLFVIDHRALVYSGFSEILCVTKDENGSRVEVVNRAET